MTGTPGGRTLPLRAPVTDGECLDSSLEALARRNEIPLSRLLPAFGWKPPPSAARLSLDVPPAVLRRAERQTGLPAGRLDMAVLDPYLRPGPVRRDGSRYCPRCLAEQGGRWMLSWRLPWSFACTTCGILLHDDCPACGRPPRRNLSWAGLNPVGTCPAPAGGSARCEADLRAVPQQQASSGLLAAQQWITGLTCAAINQDDAARTLADLPVIAGWVLRHAPAAEITALAAQARPAWESWLARPRPARDAMPASALLTGIAAALSMPLAGNTDEEAVREIRARMPAGQDPRTPRPPGMPSRQWNRLSDVGRGRFLRAIDQGLISLDRLRYRTGTAQAAVPRSTPGQIAARARCVPQLLWPGWAVRLMPAEGFYAVPFRSAIATCLLLPGNPVRAIRPADGPHSQRSSVAVNSILRTLTAGGHDSVLAAVALLAAYLDDRGSPVDYQRRRDTIPAETIGKDQWQEACGRASAHPGKGDRRRNDASRYVYELLTGADLTDPRCPLAFTSSQDKARYLGFTSTLTTPLRAALHDHASGVLASLGISEPLTWEPPPACCEGLPLPGRDPGDIDMDAVTRLVITGGVPLGEAAGEMGTTTSHLRLALEQVPRPAPQWARSTPPAAWENWRGRARSLLTRDFFEREYIRARKPLRQITAETGIPGTHLAARARELGVTVTSASQPMPIDPEWLRDQYARRSYSDIAAELGTHIATVIAAARRHRIPSRPPGVRSRPEMITTLGEDTPPDIRLAVEGSLHGWQRLDRFRHAMTCPAIGIAARQVGARPSALIHQFQRLEQDIGAQLYHRSSPGHPMRPTARGTALIEALDHPAVRAIAPPQAPALNAPQAQGQT